MPVDVELPLVAVGPVVVVLVLDDDPLLRVRHVDPADEPSQVVEDLDLQLGLRQTGADDAEACVGLRC